MWVLIFFFSCQQRTVVSFLQLEFYTKSLPSTYNSKIFTYKTAISFTNNLHTGANYMQIEKYFNSKSRPQSTKREAPFLNIFVSVCVSVLGLRGRRRGRGRDRRTGGCLDARRHVAVPLVETAQYLFAQTYQYYIVYANKPLSKCVVFVIFHQLGSFQNVCIGQLPYIMCHF